MYAAFRAMPQKRRNKLAKTKIKKPEKIVPNVSKVMNTLIKSCDNLSFFNNDTTPTVIKSNPMIHKILDKTKTAEYPLGIGFSGREESVVSLFIQTLSLIIWGCFIVAGAAHLPQQRGGYYENLK